MSELRADIVTADFKDRKVWLLVFGIGLCILGILCAMAIPMMLLSVIMQTLVPNVEGGNANSNALQMIPALLFYALAAAWFVSMGVGSIKRKRWARALTLISSWIWLISGICGLAVMASMIPLLRSAMEIENAASTASTGTAFNKGVPDIFFLIMTIVMITFMAVIYVLLPLVLVIFYSGKNVKATCQCWDEKVRWTDKSPLSVIGMSLLFVLWAISLPALGVHNWSFVFFGKVIDSFAGAAAILCLCATLILLAWRLYKLDAWAWWVSLALVLAWFGSFIMTFSGDKLWKYYEKFNMPPEQLDILKSINFQSTMVIMLSVWGVGLAVYLICIKRHFTKPTTIDNVISVEQP